MARPAVLVFLLFATALASFTQPSTAVRTSRHVYKLPAAVDRQVLASDPTELWAEVHRPRDTSAGPYPLVIFLHGNHGTCGTVLPSGTRRDSGMDYTRSGTCPPPSVVVPNHEGYRYVTAPLARRGVVVVSINANRGITANSGGSDDPGLILARGRLVLSHIAQLSRWNRGREDTPDSLGRSLRGQVDLGNVGFMGHSRGGEGVRAALDLYNEKNSDWPNRIVAKLDIKAIFEVAPVDGQSERVLDVPGVASNILLPTCDGDVSNLQGMRVFDRVFQRRSDSVSRPKSTFTVIGANHNGFNSEWQESDSFGCTGTLPLFTPTGPSPDQQKVMKLTLLAFMRAHILGESRKAKIFDPAFGLGRNLKQITFYERGHLRAPPGRATGLRIIQGFTGPDLVSDNGFRNTARGVSVSHATMALTEHDSKQRTARVEWDGGRNNFYSVLFNGSKGLDFTDVQTISFRIAVGCGGTTCDLDLDNEADVEVRVSLATRSGQFSKELDVNDYVTLRRPTGTREPHDILRTVEIALDDFTGVTLETVTEMKFTFVSPQQGFVFLGQICTDSEPSQSISIGSRQESQFMSQFARSSIKSERVSRLAIPRSPVIPPPQNSIFSASVKNSLVEFVLSSSTDFPISNSLPLLSVGAFRSNIAQVVRESRAIIFFLKLEDFLALRAGDPLTVSIGDTKWMFGGMLEPSSFLSRA